MISAGLTPTQLGEIENRLDNYAAEDMAPFGRLEGTTLVVLDLDDAIDEAEDIARVARDCARDARSSHRDGGRAERPAVASAAALVCKLKALRSEA